MSTILACTDGSPLYAASVYDHAAWAAQRLAMPVHVLHMLEPVDPPMVADMSGTIGINTSADLLAELVTFAETQGRVALSRGREILAAALRRLKDDGIESAAIEQRHGSLVDSVEHFERDAELLVIGKRGEHADFAKGHLGSNLERVIRSCHRPVLVASRGFVPIERFLVAFDGGNSAKKAINYIAENPLLKGIPAHLIAVSLDRKELGAEVEAARAKVAGAGFDVTAELLDGEPETVIADAVKRLNINLLVMGAYGHSRIRQFILGSTTTTLVRTVTIPVLMFR